MRFILYEDFSYGIVFYFYLFSTIGLKRADFDNRTVSFEQHIQNEHNMWDYLYFIVLIKEKDPTEYTGPESYVAEMIKVSASDDLVSTQEK